MVGRLLLAFARSGVGGAAARALFGHAPFLLPVRRLAEDRYAVAFRHPRPICAEHLLVVPKKAIAALLDLAQPANAASFAATLAMAGRVARDRGWQAANIVINGGPRQDVRQVHAHVVNGRYGPPTRREATPAFEAKFSRSMLAVEHDAAGLVVGRLRFDRPLCAVELADVAATVRWLDERFGVIRRGYSVWFQGLANAQEPLVCIVDSTTSGGESEQG